MGFLVNKLTAHFQQLYLAEDYELVLEQCKNDDPQNLKSSVHSAC